MSDLIKAANEAGKLVKMLKGVEDLAKAMETLGSIEQATSEANQALEAKRGEVSKAEVELLEAKSKVSEEKANAKFINEQASQKAGSIVDEAKAKAAEMMKDVLARQQQAEAKLVGLESQANDLNGKIQSRQKDLEEIEAKITKAKNYLSKMAAA